tara:strand:- start:563 stop:1213 length:651 start_codon:yes stop_codon:yes gene_type:complete
MDKNKPTNDLLVSEFDYKRSIFSQKKEKIPPDILYKNYFGFLLYIVIFVLLIPYVLIKNSHYLIATAYFSNVDIVATIIGFSGGPYDIWKHLYNPTTQTIYGFFSSTLINYLALAGVGFTTIAYAIKYGRAYIGLARLLIMVPVTYLFPGNIIVYLMNSVAQFLYSHNVSLYSRWIVTLIIGFVFMVCIIFIEKGITIKLVPYILRFLKWGEKILK